MWRTLRNSKNMKSKFCKGLFLFSTLLIGLSSCKKDIKKDSQSVPSSSGFSYKTSEPKGIEVTAPEYLANATFELYTANPLSGGKLLSKAQLNDNAYFEGTYVLPSSLKSVYLKSTYIGLQDAEIELTNGNGGVNYTVTQTEKSSSRGGGMPSAQTVNSVVYSYMGSYNNKGVPHYLTTPDVISAGLISDCNAALPEGAPITSTHPHYLASGNATSLSLTDSSQVWVTFLHEGAGYRNVLGYYVYDQGNPPLTVNDIDSIFYIFPNASAQYSGGGLKAGDKVSLGNFGANKTIGWVLLQNAWNGTSVNTNVQKFYSNPDFNPESVASKRQHNVQLYDNARELVLIGFEDLNRESSNTNPKGYKTDEDFNDLIFYVTANPFTAIDNGGTPPLVGGGTDTDNDGVPDTQDDYPNDPDKAFNNFTPFEGGFTSVAFEDLWPSKGDFDFNDLVVDANYNHITNASNEVVEMNYKIFVRHIGASFHNGYAIQWPFAPGQVSSISGNNITDGLVTLSANGTESGQSKAVLVVFDDAFDNDQDTLNITVDLQNPYNFSLLNQEGLNPFMFVNGERGKEIHLINHEPTDLVNQSYFGINKDVSNEGAGIYYRTENNEPWAISISHDYDPPVEKVDIHNAYLKFADWVNSNGDQYQDWYEDKQGYRNSSNIQ